MKGFINHFTKALASKLTVLKAAFFGLLLACSLPGFAQDLTFVDTLDSELGIAVEQVNINQADASTIALTLNGIGISRAEAIVSYRNENGEFSSIDDLIMVKGVGELTVLKNQERIVFE